MSDYTYRLTVPVPIDELRPRVEAALKDEGFGVLTEIDVAATLKAKLDLDRPPYLILGACNPSLASQALEADPSIGALLPCNVVLRSGAGAETVVEILDPLAAMGLAGPAIEPIAREAAERLRRVATAIERG
jgi:uncharacterized protein (DUF302 family)